MKVSWKPSRWLGMRSFRTALRRDLLPVVFQPSVEIARQRIVVWKDIALRSFYMSMTNGGTRPLMLAFNKGPSRCGPSLSPAKLKRGRPKAVLFFLGKSQLSLSDRNRSWVLDIRLAQELRSFFRRRGIDIETGAPLESRCLGQLRHEFNVPVVVIVGGILHRRTVN